MSATRAQGSPFTATTRSRGPHARLLGRAAVEDVRDAQALAALAGRAGVHERADAAVAGIDRLVGVAQVLRREEAGVRILEQGDHLAQQLVDLVGVVRGDDERRVLVADGLPVEPVRLRVHVGVADALPDAVEEPDAELLRHRERLLGDRRQRGLRLHALVARRPGLAGRGRGSPRPALGLASWAAVWAASRPGRRRRQHGHQARRRWIGGCCGLIVPPGAGERVAGSMLPRIVGTGDHAQQLSPVTVLGGIRQRAAVLARCRTAGHACSAASAHELDLSGRIDAERATGRRAVAACPRSRYRLARVSIAAPSSHLACSLSPVKTMAPKPTMW